MMQLFLARRDEGTIFSGLEPRQSRQQYIQEAFNREIRFEYWNQAYVYKPFASPDQEFVVGVIGRQHSVNVSGPPEEAFANKQIQDWETANLLIDSANDAQKVAMQIGAVGVGDPLNIFRALIEWINTGSASADWLLAVNAITRQEQFWEVAERYRDHIKELDLSFEVPNIWDGQSETEKALKRLRDENKAQEVEVKLKNKDGKLQPDSSQIRQSIEYISKGAGEVQLKDDHDSLVYSSKSEENNVTTAVDPDFPIQEADKGMIRNLIRSIFGK